MTNHQIFVDHHSRLTLYASLKDKVKNRAKLYEQLVVKPTRKLQWKLNTQQVVTTTESRND